MVEKFQISEDFLCSFCDFDCGPKNVEVKFFSSYLVEHKKQMKCLPQRQQKLMDYVFFVDDKTNLRYLPNYWYFICWFFKIHCNRLLIHLFSVKIYVHFKKE